MKIRCIALSFLAAAVLSAQNAPAPRHGNFDPTANTERRLTQQLNLTAAQQNQVHSAFAERDLVTKGLHQKAQDLHTAMTAAVKAGNEAQIDQISQEMATLHQQETAAHAKSAAKIYQTLTADQKSKVGEHLEMLMGGPHPGFGGPGGPRRGPAQ
jgi:Spy/CpxP family protein refolding chaperone